MACCRGNQKWVSEGGGNCHCGLPNLLRLRHLNPNTKHIRRKCGVLHECFLPQLSTPTRINVRPLSKCLTVESEVCNINHTIPTSSPLPHVCPNAAAPSVSLVANRYFKYDRRCNHRHLRPLATGCPLHALVLDLLAANDKLVAHDSHEQG